MNPTTNCVPRWATGDGWISKNSAGKVDENERCETTKFEKLQIYVTCDNVGIQCLQEPDLIHSSYYVILHFKGCDSGKNFKHIPELAEVGFVLKLDKRSFRLMKFYHFLQSGQSMESH